MNIEKINYRPNKIYKRDFSDPKPRYLLVALLILCALALLKLSSLTQSEKIHCLETSTIKSICQ